MTEESELFPDECPLRIRGSVAGYIFHTERRVPSCSDCRIAWRTYMREYRKHRREAGNPVRKAPRKAPQ